MNVCLDNDFVLRGKESIMSRYVELGGDSYTAAREAFEWDVPADYNIARDCVRKHDRDAPALYQGYPGGRRETYTFGDVDDWSDRIAHGLADRGVERGDRVAVAASQRPETPVTHLACWKIGAVTVPLSVLFGTSAMRHRLSNSGATIAVAETKAAETIAVVRDDCPSLDDIVTVETADAGGHGDDGTAGKRAVGDETFAELGAEDATGFDIAPTGPDDPALTIHTSGTTGPAKGVVHTQSVWMSYCPAFCLYFEQLDPRPMDGVYWTPSDWAWIGGLGTVLFPAWHYGRPVVGRSIRKFRASTAYRILELFEVTHASLPPTALRMLRDGDPSPSSFDLSLTTFVSGSEPLTPDIIEWVDQAFTGVIINEGYGQTEVGNVVTNCQTWFDLRPGSMGKPVPGYDVVVLDPDSDNRVEPGTVGEICVRVDGDSSGIHRGYWGDVDADGRDETDRWHRTGDLARRDEDGYLWFVAREDDVILTSGYRVGPTTVERALTGHEAVDAAGVVGVPDDRRGERITAVVTLRDGVDPSPSLRASLRALVREEVAEYAYPREVRFVDDLPTTRTGKVDRDGLRTLLG